MRSSPTSRPSMTSPVAMISGGAWAWRREGSVRCSDPAATWSSPGPAMILLLGPRAIQPDCMRFFGRGDYDPRNVNRGERAVEQQRANLVAALDDGAVFLGLAGGLSGELHVWPDPGGHQEFRGGGVGRGGVVSFGDTDVAGEIDGDVERRFAGLAGRCQPDGGVARRRTR